VSKHPAARNPSTQAPPRGRTLLRSCARAHAAARPGAAPPLVPPPLSRCAPSFAPAGYAAHVCRQSLDSGWGCGYRNLQMLASHLLARRPDLAAVLFGGCGWLPDIRERPFWGGPGGVEAALLAVLASWVCGGGASQKVSRA
jgi:hypothetical protein